MKITVTGSIPINRGLIQAIPTSLPPQPIGEATKASNFQRIPPGVQGRSHFTYFLYLIVQIRILKYTSEGEVIEEFRARNDARMVSKVFGYPSDYDHDKKIRMDCAYNLKFSCMIVLEDMDAYRDEGMGDVIFGEPFLREVRINAKRFEGMITIHNGNEEVTYQMVRSHSRFKHHTNEQCNKIPPLLKVSEEDKMNEISHSYQKLGGFYKGVLNLGLEYVQDADMEEWLTRRHISLHETE
ncbi:hypothetical protein Tco_0900176 [Tanacetum coccineum]